MVGNIPNFTEIDVLRCFLKLGNSIGRQELAKKLELGEGTVRTILKLLKSRNLLESSKKGHSLSKRGYVALDRILKIISGPKPIKMQDLYPEYKKAGVLLRNSPDNICLHKARDFAVKNGADGALILKFNGKLYAPESDYKQDYMELEKYFNFNDNESLIIAFSNKDRNAENGALAIAIEISQSLKSFVHEIKKEAVC